MKMRTHYNRIERQVYEFNVNDIRSALMVAAKITYQPGRRIEFDIVDNSATLTVVYEYPEESRPTS